MKEGSGWQLDEVLQLDFCLATYAPLKGSSYLPLPDKLRNTKAIVKFQNSDSKCFVWSVLTAFHPVDQNPQVSHYKQYEGELDLKGINFPMSIDQVPKFEKQNQISVNIFDYE